MNNIREVKLGIVAVSRGYNQPGALPYPAENPV